MANEIKRIVIEIKGDGGVEKQSIPERHLKPSQDKKKKPEQKTASVIANQSFNTLKNLTKQTANSSISRYLNLSENYLAGSTYQDVNTILSNANNLVSTLNTSLNIGAMGGAIGGAVGLGLGFATFAVSTQLQYLNKLSNYYSQLNAANAQTEWGARRAGLFDGGRGTEN